MSLSQRERDNLSDDLVRILGFTTVGPVRYPNLVLAQIRSVDWQSERAPAFDERGGSSSPTEVTERLEDRRVARQAIRDEHDLAELIPALDAELVLAAYHRSPTRELAQVAQRLAEIVYRCTKAVDHNTLPGEPECRSCARPGKVGKQQYRGHKGVGVYEKAVKHRLCRWCYDHWRAEGRLPPVDVIDLYHRVSAKAAGLELAKRLRRKAS